MSSLSEIEAFFSENGPLAGNSSSYSFRQAQVEMAKRIAEAIHDGQNALVVEASTGTGKSFAYLAAALLSGKKTIVSTATKALQDQLFQNDLPVIAKSVYNFTSKVPSALLLKGRNNYVCLKKIDERGFTPSLFSSSDEEESEQIVKWAAVTETGDYSELVHFPENSPALAAFDARSEHCVGQSCTFYNDCFVVRQRRMAQKVDLLVVNHSLLCTDSAIRAKSTQSDDEELGSNLGITSQILPDFDVWIIDEAHAFADVATRNFGFSIGDKDLRLLSNDLLYVAAFLAKNVQESLRKVSLSIAPSFIAFIEALLDGRSSASISFLEGMSDTVDNAFQDLRESLRETDIALISATSTEVSYLPELKTLSRRVNDLVAQLNYITQGVAQKNGHLVVVENASRGFSLSAWPISPAKVLKNNLWDLEIPTILTSATIAFDGSAKSFCSHMGLKYEDEKNELILPPIFDFEKRSALYVAGHLPYPNDPEFKEQSHDEIRFLVNLSLGGTLILFTSHRALNDAYFALKDEFSQMGLQVLKQGDAPKMALLREFMRAEDLGGGVLFATHSFWEGVDVPGRALRMVIIDKLPFKTLSDPLFEARMSECEANGGSPFFELALPTAALTLKQGIGRLLRKDDDAGMAALLDSRVIQKSYGKRILNTLPPMPRFTRRSDIENVWNHHIKNLIGGWG